MIFKRSRANDIASSTVLLCLIYCATDCAAQSSTPTTAQKTAAASALNTQPAGKTPETVQKKSIEALVDDSDTVTNHHGMSSDYNLFNGQVEQAITNSRKALRRDPDNIEAHKSYAEALDQKIQFLKSADPELLRDCISEWLIVFRSEVGEEKGLGFHGISVLGNLYKDEGYAITARQRLVAIAGRAPRPWETNTMYLKSVLRRASVNGKIINH